MKNLNAGQRVSSSEGPGEVLTVFGDKVVIKLDSGSVTALEDQHVGEAPEQQGARARQTEDIVSRLNNNNENHQIQKLNPTMEISEKSLDVVNDLIKINNDRVAGFEKAAKDLEGDANGIVSIFTKLAGESQRNVTELTAIAQQTGGEVAEGTSGTGGLHRAWIDLKSAFTGSDLLAILNECERGEDAAKQAYEDALDPDNELSAELVQVLQRQQRSITAGHDQIKSLCDQVDTSEDQDENLNDDNEADEVVAEPSYEEAAGEYAPEPGTIAQDEKWTEGQASVTGNSRLMEFFVNELKDLLWAEKELVDTLPDIAEAATSQELKDAFESHLAETETHVSRLEQIFGVLGLEPDTRKCDAMAGIVDEGDEIISATEEGTAQRDVGLIFAGQKVEHYEIASYGGMIALAKTLGYYEVVETLVLTLDEEKSADAKLTEIAESRANYAANTERTDD